MRFVRNKKYILTAASFVIIIAIIAIFLARCNNGNAQYVKVAADSLYMQSHNYLSADNYSSAYNDVSEAYGIYAKLKDVEGMAKSHVRLSIIYYGMGQTEQAQEQLDLAEPQLNILPPEVKASFYRISAILKTEGESDYPKAVELMKKGIEADSLVGSIPGMYADIGNLAEIYINCKEYDKAWLCLAKLSDTPDESAKPMLAQKYLCLGRIAYELGQQDEAEHLLGRSIDYAKNHNLLGIEAGAMKMMTDIDSIRHNRESYISHFKTWITLKDSLQGSQITYRIACMQERTKIAQMEQEHKERQYRQNLLSILAVTVIMMFALVLFFLYRRTKNMREIAELKSEQLEYKINLEQLQKELLELKVREGESQLDKANKENLSMSLKLATINQEDGNGMEKFDMSFMQMDEKFCQSLTALHPNISSTEMRLACFIRLHMNANEMAKAMNISAASLYKQRYRLRKKLGLTSEQGLEAYISSIAPREMP